MYEKKNVPEPTCEGWWWVLSKHLKHPLMVRYLIVRATGCRLIEDEGTRRDFDPWRSHHEARFYGPIPVPEEEPEYVYSHGEQHANDSPRDGMKKRKPKKKPTPEALSAGRQHGIEVKCAANFKSTQNEDEEDPCASCDHTDEDGSPTCGHRPCGPPTPKGCSHWKEREPALASSTIPAQPPPLSGKPSVSDEAIADEIRATAMMLLDGVLHAGEWLAAARRVRAKIERKEENKCVSNEELGRIVLTVLRGVHHTLDAEYYEDRTYREVGRLLRARLEV